MVHHISSRSAFFPATPITFTEQDLSSIRLPHDDPLIIKLWIEDCVVSRVLVDGGSSTDILFCETFDKMGLNYDIKLSIQPLVALNSDRVIPFEVIKLKVHAAEILLDVDFQVVNCYSTLNTNNGLDMDLFDAGGDVNTASGNEFSPLMGLV